MMRQRAWDRLACGLCILFALDRLLKHLATWHFFRRPQPRPPAQWPTVTLVQPITRGTSNLAAALRSRARLDYPAPIQHLLICDVSDTQTQAIVAAFLTDCPVQAEVVLVSADVPQAGAVASKIRKLQAALPRATGEVVCFVDDDVSARPETLRILIPHLARPGTGAAFGLPCSTNWRTPWSSLLSSLVNGQMLLNFVALTYLSDPFRITGQFVAFDHHHLKQAGGLEGLEQYIDDDFELARRLCQRKLRAVQTPLVYDIENDVPDFKAYQNLLKRWFVLPRQAMMPSLSRWQRAVALVTTASLALPCMLGLLALFTRRRAAVGALLTGLGLSGASYMICERIYLRGRMPLHCWLLLPVVALVMPLDIARHLLSNNEIEWRGQWLRVQRDGRREVIV